MRVIVYPADQYGCGHHRLIWPAEELIRAGHDVSIVKPKDRHLRLQVNDADQIVGVDLPADTDVVVLQRVTHRYLAEVIPIIRAKGVAVVVDVDDDLASIHPSNPAWRDLHPNRENLIAKTKSAKPHMHSWHNLAEACKTATLVTTTTPALIKRYASHGRGIVLPNYLARHYFEHRVKSPEPAVVWPASLHSHPDDPSVVGNAVQRLVHDGVRFKVLGSANGVADAFGCDAVESIEDHIDIEDWPRELARSWIGIAPLANTRFNAAKSWLKPLELAAVGVPWVASPRVEYRRLHELGCGLLADKPKFWYALVRKLTREPTLWADLSDAGRAVARELSLELHAWRWWEAWDHALRLERGLTSNVERRQLADRR